MKRQSIGKKLRFEIFARDNFTCRYCGMQSDQVRLVIDHVIPVCKGGTNEPENLATCCEPCNQGKSGNLINKVTTSESHRLALAQEMRDQLETIRSAKRASKARQELRQEVCNYICEARGVDSVRKIDLNVFCSLAQRYGVESVFRWIDVAAARLSSSKSSNDFLRYVCGIKNREEAQKHA